MLTNDISLERFFKKDEICSRPSFLLQYNFVSNGSNSLPVPNVKDSFNEWMRDFLKGLKKANFILMKISFQRRIVCPDRLCTSRVLNFIWISIMSESEFLNCKTNEHWRRTVWATTILVALGMSVGCAKKVRLGCNLLSDPPGSFHAQKSGWMVPGCCLGSQGMWWDHIMGHLEWFRGA